MTGAFLRAPGPRRAAVRAGLLALALGPALAGAAPAPDPAVQEAGDANLESTEHRRGLTFAGSLGAGLVVGFGIEDSVGRGPAVSLRLGHVATRRTVITFELSAVAALHKPATMNATETNTSTNLLAGAQHYVNPSLSLRLAGGLGVFRGRQVELSGGRLGNVMRIGPAVLGGIGLEVMRFRWATLCIEVATSAMVNRDGVLVASGANLGLTFD